MCIHLLAPVYPEILVDETPGCPDVRFLSFDHREDVLVDDESVQNAVAGSYLLQDFFGSHLWIIHPSIDINSASAGFGNYALDVTGPFRVGLIFIILKIRRKHMSTPTNK